MTAAQVFSSRPVSFLFFSPPIPLEIYTTLEKCGEKKERERVGENLSMTDQKRNRKGK